MYLTNAITSLSENTLNLYVKLAHSAILTILNQRALTQ